jgi:glyceraldehyde 3-phosphate dehydrogenase
LPVRVGISGFGAIGRRVLRLSLGTDVEVRAINSTAPLATMAHLLRYDSNYGRFPGTVTVAEGALEVNGRPIPVVSEREPGRIPWGDLGVDVVLECTGKFRRRQDAYRHIAEGGAKKVIISAPGKDDDVTIVMGVNEDAYDPRRHEVISNGSCTTNCLLPVVKVLKDAFGVESLFAATVHAYTRDQSLLDGTHRDLRRARAAAQSIIPTSTGASEALGRVYPELAPRAHGIAYRVPTATVSLLDLAVVLGKAATREEINEAFQVAAAGALHGILGYTEDPVVSVDLKGDEHSAVVDGLLTASHGREAKVVAWYDNEWGYSARMVDIARYVGSRLT